MYTAKKSLWIKDPKNSDLLSPTSWIVYHNVKGILYEEVS
jgi:hypothetical protein